MSLEQNRALARRFIEDVVNRGDLAAIDEIFAKNYVNYQHHHPDSTRIVRGIEAWKKFISEFRRAFPDFHETIEDQIAEGDKVVTRFTSKDTHKGNLMGIKPTNKQLSWTGIAIDRIESGKIVESWVNWDMMGMMQQLGVISLPE